MNSWCESCARKNCCYTMEIRPKCYLPTTNTAHGTPETYLAKSLRYSRDSHEIAKDEPQFDKDINVRSKTEPNCSEKPNNCDTCKHNKLEWYSEVCDGCSKANSNYEPKTEPQRGYMWKCPKCGTEHHSDFESCPCCGWNRIEDEPQTERSK